MINTINFLRILNAFMAILAVPASVGMFVYLTKESSIIPKLSKNLIIINKILRMMFVGIAIGALVNSVFSLFLAINFEVDTWGEIGDIAFNFRNLVINTFFTFSSWSFFAIKKLKK